jgi:phosphopantetheine--protein transferase-like protein
MGHNTYKVQVRLLNVSEVLAVELDTLLQTFEHPSFKVYSAEDYIRAKLIGVGLPDGMDETRGEVLHSIRKFVKVNDRILALASCLLKSEAFFLSHHYPQDGFVHLPRTEHQKPFIPTIDETEFSISLSHQWPFIGISRLVSNGGKQSLGVGLDIVVFEKLNTRLYNTVEEFVAVFRNSFTDGEWLTINEQQDFVLQEFYVQWSVKEAVSKALGVGLGCDFSSFEVTWDLKSPTDGGLWNLIVSHGSQNDEDIMLDLNGTISLNEPEISNQGTSCIRDSNWRFCFLALRDSETSDVLGVACTCLGPFQVNDVVDKAINWKVEWTDLRSILPVYF